MNSPHCRGRYYFPGISKKLTREDNQRAGKSWTWTYDDAGNILSKKEYAYTTGTLGSATSTKSYSYDNSNWGDLLTGYNGNTVSSDAIGNILSDGKRTYTWEHGRELATVAYNGSTWTNTYDADGMRTARTNGSTAYSYVYNGGSLSQMTVGGNTLYFAYDASGTPLSVTYNGTAYYYATNLQGDITTILNTSGTAVVTYTYDAWGNILAASGSMASTLGTHNPLRYRGYVYDTETGLYYLQSRYYDPEMGRFVNADALVTTGQGLLGNNTFAYCHNNPVNYCDPTGMLLYPGEIHNAVVKHIANEYQLAYEQRILYGNGKYGRADLISLDGQVWDVKRDKPWHIEAGKRQVKNYVANTWQKAPEGVTLKVGGELIESGSFYHQSGQTTYKVTYRNAGNGVIAYDYAPVKRQTQSVTNPSVIAAGAAITAGIVLGLITSRVSVKNN